MTLDGHRVDAARDGFDAHLVTPVLYEEVARLLGRARGGEA